MGSRLVFTDRWHRYSLDGERVPSVTNLVRVIDAPALDRWKVRQAAQWASTHLGDLETMGEPEWIKAACNAAQTAMNEGAKRGRQVHLLAESLILGEPLPEADENGEPITDEVSAISEQLVRFFDAWGVVPLAREAFVFHETDKWAGRLDLIADLGDGRRWLLDYKTSTGVYPETSLQLCAYRHATHLVWQDRDIAMPKVDACGVVWLRPDQWELVPVRADADTYDVFRSLRAPWRWTKWPDDESVWPPLPAPEVAS